MLLFVESNLIELKAYLKNKGYNIVDYNNGNPSDIYIYSQRKIDFHTFESSIAPCSSGSLIINADNVSLFEIENIIKQRTYTPLFE